MHKRGKSCVRELLPGSSVMPGTPPGKLSKQELDRELEKLRELAQKGPNQDFAGRLSRSFVPPGAQPDTLLVRETVSAALEFLEASLTKVRGGANQRKNDPGLYIDFQLLLYLADPEITFLTSEDMIHKSSA